MLDGSAERETVSNSIGICIDKVCTYTILYTVKYDFDYSEEKDSFLKEIRKISFGDVIDAFKKGKALADLEHVSKRYPHQRLLIVEIEHYVYVSPYVIDEKRKKIFLKTVYASRKLTKKYIKNKNEKNQKI